MSNFVISTRYANALMQTAEDNKAFERVLDDISLIYNALDSSRELRNTLDSPIISSDKKSEILAEIFNSKISGDVQNFLKFLIEKGRENLLFDITKRFLILSNEKLGRLNVNITSAVQLDEKQKSKIKNQLESMLNKTVIPNYNIDESIIGGFKAKYSDTVIDASVKHQLELLKVKLFEQNFLSN